MKLVTLTRDMKPARAGETRLLPDDVAERLVQSGEAKDPKEYPERPAAAIATAPSRQTFKTRKG